MDARKQHRQGGRFVRAAWDIARPAAQRPPRESDVSPVLAVFATTWNGSLDDAGRARLDAFLPRLAGTAGDLEVDELRAAMALGWLVRTFTAAWLRLANLLARADELAALPDTPPAELAKAAQPIIEAAEREANTAWIAVVTPATPTDAVDVVTTGAALAVAAAAAGTGAWARAWDVAQAAGGRKAAWLAIRDAIWDTAAGASGGAAAERAADPTCETAPAGHHDAKYGAAYRAARSIFERTFRETTAELAESAFHLLDAMIDVRTAR